MSGTLTVRDLHVRYGAFEAVRGVSLDVEPGEILAVFGHNGAGKTSTLRTISGLKAPAAGTVLLDGRDVSATPPSARAHLGLAFVPDGARGVFPTLSVEQNLALARITHPTNDPEDRRRQEASAALLDELFKDVLGSRGTQLASSLSGGERQMLALALAIARSPAWLLLDEPSLGLAPKAVERLMGAIAVMRDRLGTAILIVEQDVGPVLEIADRVTIMKSGLLVHSMPASECPPPREMWAYF